MGNDNKRILFVVTKLKPAETGGELYNLKIAEKLEASGFTVTVHTEDEIPSLFRRAPFAWIPYTRLFLLQSSNSIILASHGLQSRLFIPLVLLKILRKTKSLAIVHAILHYRKSAFWRIFGNLINLIFFQNVNHIITNSNHTKQQVIDFIKTGKETTVVYPGVQLEVPRIQRNHSRKEITVISVGILSENKGHHLVLEALRDIDLEFRFIIAGARNIFPDYTVMLQGLIERDSLSRRAELLGRVEKHKLSGLLGAADIFISASDYEGFGIANLEAASFGLPIIATTGGATPELFTDGENAILVPPRDVPALRNALKRLLNDPDLRERLGKNAQQLPILKRTWEEATDEVEAVIRRQLADNI